MKQNLASLVSSVSEAQRRVRDSARQTPEWRAAERVAVQARLDYWNAMCLTWDARHPKATESALPVNNRPLVSASVRARGSRRWLAAPHYVQATIIEKPPRRALPCLAGVTRVARTVEP